MAKKLSFFHLISAVLLLLSSVAASPSVNIEPPTVANQDLREELWLAYLAELDKSSAIQSGRANDLLTPVLDEAFISADGQTAMLWIALQDPSGRILATEPGMVLARNTELGWSVVFPGDRAWAETLSSFPAEQIPVEQAVETNRKVEKVGEVKSLGGYYLPYVAGTRRWLEGSILHFHSFPERGYPSCSQNDCAYAYDFTDVNHFPLVASKDGTVAAAKDSCADGSSYCTNYVVLKSTDGYYQLYLHLAYGTVPDKLTAGATVRRGQYIGDTDDTGYSTSNHVHFMVVRDWWMGSSGSPWGYSVDVRFADVAINSGIPRTCYEVTQLPIQNGATECLGTKTDPLNANNDWFPSGNTGAFPPSGVLKRPTEGKVVATANVFMDVTAQGTDDVRATKVALLALVDDIWKQVGAAQPTDSTGLADWDADLCALGPLNGPLALKLKVWDHEGNEVVMPAVTTVTVDHACLPPVSAMTTPITTDSTAVRLNWTAAPSPSGLSKFELQWRVIGSAWAAEQTITLGAGTRSTWFVGSMGKIYEFRLRAFDTNGQAEAWPADDAAEVSVAFPSICAADGGEPDDTSQTARLLEPGIAETRNFCPEGDVDWFEVDTADWPYYLVASTPLGEAGATVKVSVYASDAATLLAESNTPSFLEPTTLFANVGGQSHMFIKVEPTLGSATGTAAQYALVVKPQYAHWLPLIWR